jgi:hypothetical protein
MAKSTRSKVKRAFRAKKRTEGVYAATEAARLARLNAKLSTLRAKSPSTEEVSGEDIEDAEGDIGMQGACNRDLEAWCVAVGLMDPERIHAEAMGMLGPPACLFSSDC